MSTREPGPPAPPASRLSIQLGAMGLSERALPEAAVAAERRAMSGVTPLPLNLPAAAPQAPWRQRGAWAGLAAAAALVALVLVKTLPRTPPAFQVMGGGSVHVYLQQNGEVWPWTPQAKLTVDSRVAAEVQAGEAASAFWGAATRDRRLLTAPTWIWEHRLTLPAGAKAFFPGSLQLDGPSEGETLSVVVCPAAGLDGVSADEQTALVAAAIGTGAAPAGKLAGCRAERFPLRP